MGRAESAARAPASTVSIRGRSPGELPHFLCLVRQPFELWYGPPNLTDGWDERKSVP